MGRFFLPENDNWEPTFFWKFLIVFWFFDSKIKPKMDIRKKKQKKKSHQNIEEIRITFLFFCSSLVHETFARHCGRGVQHNRSEESIGIFSVGQYVPDSQTSQSTTVTRRTHETICRFETHCSACFIVLIICTFTRLLTGGVFSKCPWQHYFPKTS